MKQKFYALRSWMTLLLLCFMGSAWGQTVTVEQTTFTATNANSIGGDIHVGYTTAKGGGTSNPAINNGVIRLYQNSAGTGGGTITVTAADGYVLRSVTIGSSMKTSIAYTLDNSSEKSEKQDLAANGKYEVPDLDATSITFQCMGTSSTTRLYVNYLSVTYESKGGEGVEFVATPTFTPASGTLFDEAQEVTITTATEGATIYYTTDGTEPTTASTAYTGSFSITETTTVKAIAVKEGMENSGVATAVYNKVETLKGIAGLKTAITSTTEVNVAAVLTNAVVTAVNGSNVLLEDGEAGITLFTSGHGLKVGNVINGMVTGTAKLYSGLRELVSIDLSSATVTEGGEIPATELTLSELSANFDKYESMRIKITDATVSKAFAPQSGEITQGEASMALWAVVKGMTADADAQVDVFGYPGLHGADQQLRILAQEDIIVKTAGKTTATLAFAASAYAMNIGEVQTNVATTNSTAAVEYVSSDESVATVDAVSGEVTAVAAGTATITARVAENDEYTEAEASYTLTVVDPNAEIEGMAFVACKDGVYSAMTTNYVSNKFWAKTVSVVNGKVVLVDGEENNITWKVDVAKGLISTDGSYLAFTSKTNIKLQNQEYKWKWDNEKQMWLASTDDTRALGQNGEKFGTYQVTDNTYPKAVSMPIAYGYVRNVTAENFGTICLPNHVSATDYSGVEFYTVAGKRTENGTVKSVVLVEATELTAGTPYIFRATTDKLVAAYSGDAVTVAGSENGLYGALTAINAGQDADDTTLEGMYMLTGNKLQLCGKGCWLGANRAYINMTEVPEADASVKGLEIGFDGSVTAIETVKNNGTSADVLTDVYTLSGVCVRTQVRVAEATIGLPKGIYLVNGEKVIVK